MSALKVFYFGGIFSGNQYYWLSLIILLIVIDYIIDCH